ncbi:DsbA family oxidoreductase [Microbulbifer bruguierae]|uniref:DsbA family oxidoreductase n=1 Tax=Microbulbifer bruguierae TaxID=3029061 RepID=A0ABY8NB53_9GAMM|nr:DsbA family oxidoreductase [Microbulbifer bruguierae]WGL16146.1 DsbA family oxidoreductase [Microbulbifer bruguierae]
MPSESSAAIFRGAFTRQPDGAIMRNTRNELGESLMPQPYLRIDIVSDVVCPWCVIGYLRLQQALQACPQQFDLNIVWHPFELNPQMLEAGENLREHITGKYRISSQQSESNRQRLTEFGRELDFAFNFSDEMRIYNTRRAHTLLHWAETSGKQTELQLRLFRDYFSEGKSLNHDSVLLDAAESVGLDRDAAAAALDDTAMTRQTIAREEQLLLQGIQGVPLFMFNHEYAISGAEDTEVFLKQLEQIGSMAPST